MVTTTLLSDVQTIKVGQPLSFNILGLDSSALGNFDLLLIDSLSTDLNDLGISFSTVSGTDSLSAPFGWTPDCNILDYDSIFLTFAARKSLCSFDTFVYKTITFVPDASVQPPLITVGVNNLAFSWQQGIPLTFPVSAIDPDSGIISLSATGLQSGMMFNDTTGTNISSNFNWQTDCLNARPAPYTISFTASKTFCDSVIDTTVTLTIQIIDTLPDTEASLILPPAFPAFLPQDSAGSPNDYILVQIGQGITFPVTGQDAENDSMTLSLQALNFASQNTALTFDSISGTPLISSDFSWTPGCGDIRPQPYVVQFRLDEKLNCDSIRRIERKIYLLVVDTLPDTEASLILPPAFPSFLPQDSAGSPNDYILVQIGQGITFPVTGQDAENDSMTLSLQALNFASQNTTLTFDSISGTPLISSDFSWTPGCGDIRPQPYVVQFRLDEKLNCDSIRRIERKIYLLVVDTLPDTEASLILPPAFPSFLPQDSAGSPNDYILVQIGQGITFPVIGQDAENDSMTLSLQALNFASQNTTLTFDSISGTPLISSDFSWTPGCGDVSSQPYVVQFRLDEEPACGGTRRTERKIYLLVVDTLPDANANLILPPLPSFSPQETLVSPVDYIVVQANEGISFPVAGQDIETNFMSLSMQALNFTKQSTTLTFDSVAGRQFISSDFSWTPGCGDIRQQPYIVQFRLEEVICGITRKTERKMYLLVADTTIINFNPANVITPNGDGLNEFFSFSDILKQSNCEYLFADLKMYNRWGKPVFETSDGSFKWDGDNVPAGVYFYVVTFKAGFYYRGWLSVLR